MQCYVEGKCKNADNDGETCSHVSDCTGSKTTKECDFEDVVSASGTCLYTADQLNVDAIEADSATGETTLTLSGDVVVDVSAGAVVSQAASGATGTVKTTVSAGTKIVTLTDVEGEFVTLPPTANTGPIPHIKIVQASDEFCLHKVFDSDGTVYRYSDGVSHEKCTSFSEAGADWKATCEPSCGASYTCVGGSTAAAEVDCEPDSVTARPRVCAERICMCM